MSVEAYNTRRLGPSRQRVHGKWIGYRGESRWHPIAAAFVETSDGFSWTRGPAQYHVGKHLHDGARVVADNRWDIFSRAQITAPAAEFELQPIGGFNVAGQFDPPAQLAANYPHVSFAADQSQVWHPEAGGPGLHVRWTIHHGRAPRMTRELVVDPKACPQRDLSLSWDVRSPRVLALVRNQSGQLVRPWNGSPGDAADVPTTGVSIVSVPDQAAADQIAAELADGATATGLRRGSGIKPPLVWYWKRDGILVTAPATVRAEIQSDGETVRFTKTVPLSVIESAAAENSYVVSDDSQTIYPDPHAETTSCDGVTYRFIPLADYGTTEPYSALIANAGTGAEESSTVLRTALYTSGSTTRFFRTLIGFDLSTISGTVTEASLSLYIYSVFPSTRNCRLTGAAPASNTALAAGDHQPIYDDYDESLSADFITPTSGRFGTAYNTAGLDYWTDQLGNVGFTSVRLAGDKVGGSPQYTDQTYFRSAEYSGTSSDPYLDITYGAAAEEIDDTVVRRQQQLAR